jgi:DNA polymerase elongation subunit (family B)
MLANTGNVSIYEAPYASVIVANRFSDYYYKNNQVFVKDEEAPEDDGDSYTGGYVMEPGKGIFEGVSIEDYESMFPSLMMMMNAGVETYLGQTQDNGRTFQDIYGKYHNMDPNKHCWAMSGAVYDKTKESSMRHVLSEIFGDRVKAKTDGFAIDNEIKYLKDLLKTA